jgi:hypothetical protein
VKILLADINVKGWREDIFKKQWGMRVSMNLVMIMGLE